MVQKQLPKARNQLKRISKSPYNPEFGDEIEKGNLMLVEHYIEKGKYDIAQQLCNKVLSQNKSSAKAHEQLGLIMEKEASYRDAADNYESAWKHDGEASAAAGFKLAFNYLKAERFVEAIDVCHKVIKMYPNYPRIREEILDKARESLRMA